jgi:hypothetical protein
MAGLLGFRLESRFYGDFTMDNLNSRQLCIVNGDFDYDAASSSALTVTAALVGLNDIKGFIAAPKGGVFWQFNPANDTVQPVGAAILQVTGTGVATFSSSATIDIASITSIPFLCWGFR